MKITDTIISIPPYISTRWDNISSLHMQENDLIFTLLDGKTVTVKYLSPEAVEQIFSAHASFLEGHPEPTTLAPMQQMQEGLTGKGLTKDQLFAFPFRLNTGSIENMGVALQHNPAYSGLPPIPEDVALKISTLSKIISEEDILAMPPAEDNCNCMYCQINRILRKNILQNKEPPLDHPLPVETEESVSEADLRFEQWEVKFIRENMYTVSNKLDLREQYTVYLGHPVGCTCGRPNCEHIIAVLRS